MPDKISGKIFFDPLNGGHSGYSIVVNRKDPFARKRFTVAHEIAHFILHRERIGNSLTDDALYRSGLTTREEAQANRLAAEILMPGHLLRGGLGGDPHVLAERFQVSEAAMNIRLESLQPK
ncbi:MAG: ImmA/IrrE family metallo-endopeptidase [Bryobacterales bacterium]|nr:ImmA/IrrE family metallo-endopeptidase [Bryobacterales bacterium]